MDQFSRTSLLIGKDAMDKLEHSSVAVFGIGGVGSYAVEALARSGVGRLALFDADTVCLTNINRQIIATHKTLGRKKVDVMKERVLQINPLCAVTAYDSFYSSKNAAEYDFSDYSYIVDAIDTVSSKLVLIEMAKAANIPVISCMGTGNKLDPTMLEVSDISKTSVCPLARVMRKELRTRGIFNLKVVFSREPPISPVCDDESAGGASRVPGSISFVPSCAGLIIASEVVKDIVGRLSRA